jgi:hypothetical protein
MPKLLTTETVRVTVPGGAETEIANPLYSYKLPVSCPALSCRLAGLLQGNARSQQQTEDPPLDASS